MVGIAGEGQQPEGQQEAAELQPPIIPERFRIEDTDAWFRNNSIRDEATAPPTLDQQEDRARFEESNLYQRKLHESLFADVEANEEQRQKERASQLEALKNCKIIFHTADGVSLDELPLRPFAESCDTIFALATSWIDEESERETVDCKLEDYSSSSVQKFAKWVLGTQKEVDLDADSVVDCCCIADYLQNQRIRDATEEILKRSIDTTNCLSICSLADQLGMPSLFERSLQHMMRTLGTVEEGSACWSELTPELRERIVIIKAALQSSVHSQGSKLYFNSLHEYISIFAERVQYYRERLADAKDQLQSIRPGTRLWTDTQMKISKQERRVHTLATALAEQKKMFGKSRNLPLPRRTQSDRD
eukprot:CAMPEP_0198154664 /NCGR_PEP_ID=MMETSP1443-20131203/68720_1 /TAXON_ID=186043 /ORGANISM="Entomoneis sp., Strain CCMP2396" /LENGTH=361 /DNA_ID=CAMNT_0043821359 /DNA_START=956 /DNA_END=2041 /DNA_ORIENTATION=-